MSFLQDLEIAVSRGSPESRQRALWYATDLLITGHYTDDEIWMFGEIIGLLERDLAAAARAQLAKRLARNDNAPSNIIKKLAFDDSIHIAGPVLRQSERLDSQSLVANAKSKSQLHLLAISQRKSISAEVTDVLVVRGNTEVARSVAKNDGACFSNFGILQLVKRSKDDSILVERLGRRKDIPRHLFQQMIAKAADNVRKRLESENTDTASQLQTLVPDVAGRLQSIFGPASKDYFEAKRGVAKLKFIGELNEKTIFEYAQSHRFEEVNAGLSLLCSLPVDLVERALRDKSKEALLILAKVLGFSWETTMALLFLGAPDHHIRSHMLEDLRREFAELNIETSRSVLKTYQSRKLAVAADSGECALPQLHSQ